MKESAKGRSPSRQDLHELGEQLAVLLIAVEAPELVEHVVENIVRLEILAACDEPMEDAWHTFQVGLALMMTCESLLSQRSISSTAAERRSKASSSSIAPSE
jgi:hypothetical protein